MIARDLMNSQFPYYVTADADPAYVASLLSCCQAGAIQVVDERLKPIGIVTRSDLSDYEKDGSQSPRQSARSIRDVMTPHPVSVDETTALVEILRLLETRPLKRIPVVNGDRLVGLLLRKQVIDAASQLSDRAPPKLSDDDDQQGPGEFSAAHFRALVSAHEQALEAEAAQHRRQIEELREQRMKELAARRLTDAAWRQMLTSARNAAGSGLREFMLIRFPSGLCSDGGRAINAPDTRWPETLRGEPADIFRRWREELQPQGFQIAAQIVDFPDGLPGDAALFLMWGGGENP
jgi:CBS domain-containing protein